MSHSAGPASDNVEMSDTFAVTPAFEKVSHILRKVYR